MNLEDVSVDNISDPLLLKLGLKVSKTDPFRTVDIVLGRINNKLCPISAFLANIAIRRTKSGFLFSFIDGRLLTKARFVCKVREALSRADISSSNCAGHCSRIGGRDDSWSVALVNLLPRC